MQRKNEKILENYLTAPFRICYNAENERGFFGKMPMYLENFGRRYEDYLIDTSDEDWLDNQVVE